MVVLFLFRITVKAQVIEYSGCSQSERKCHPYSYDSPIHDETEKIAGRQGDKEIGDECDIHHGFHICDSTKGIGEIYL
jgi:hypothetical protein